MSVCDVQMQSKLKESPLADPRTRVEPAHGSRRQLVTHPWDREITGDCDVDEHSLTVEDDERLVG